MDAIEPAVSTSPLPLSVHGSSWSHYAGVPLPPQPAVGVASLSTRGKGLMITDSERYNKMSLQGNLEDNCFWGARLR